MIGYFFTTVTHDAGALAEAQEAVTQIAGAAARSEGAVMASPSSSYAGPLDAGVREVSLLTSLPDEILAGAAVASPVRYFRDAYGAAFLSHIHNAVRRGGWVAVPFHTDRLAERTGFWSLAWLETVLGRADKADGQMALFQRGAPLHPPRSVLSFFMRDGYGYAADYFKDRTAASTAQYLERCSDFLAPPLALTASDEEAANTHVELQAELDKFFSNMNYSVTGAGYKAEGLRRLIAAYLPRKEDIRVADLGGGAGFVGVELLLTSESVSKVVNCEPLAASLPLNRRLYRWFEPWLRDRYKVCPSPAQDFPFDEEFDVVSAFASLLYVPREKRAETLERAWNALRPGGVFVIHENIKRPLFAERDYFDIMFTVEELEAELSRFGRIDYYRSTDIMPMTREQTGDLTVFRVVQKK